MQHSTPTPLPQLYALGSATVPFVQLLGSTATQLPPADVQLFGEPPSVEVVVVHCPATQVSPALQSLSLAHPQFVPTGHSQGAGPTPPSQPLAEIAGQLQTSWQVFETQD